MRVRSKAVNRLLKLIINVFYVWKTSLTHTARGGRHSSASTVHSGVGSWDNPSARIQ